MMKKIGLIVVLALIVWFVLAHLPQQKTQQSNNINKQGKSTQVEVKDIKNMKAIIKTNKGDIEITFDERAPKTVENFVKLAKEGFYNGTKFHRVIKDFMIQGGDPLSKDDELMGRWGTGGPGYQFDDEIHEGNNNVVGSIAMANAGPNTNGSQFFINTKDNNFLDMKHTVFGNVTKGLDVVRKIESTETFPDDKPIEPIVIESIEIVE